MNSMSSRVIKSSNLMLLKILSIISRELSSCYQNTQDMPLKINGDYEWYYDLEISWLVQVVVAVACHLIYTLSKYAMGYLRVSESDTWLVKMSK